MKTDDRFDAIVVGAGAAGCLAAARLAQAGRSVLVLEAGPERSLRDLNSSQLWARRLLGANAALLLVTDGLDRDEHGDLSAAAARLHRLAHQVVWLNPLLRYAGFEAKAAGVRALLPHVDRFLPVHNLASLADLGKALRAPPLAPHTLLH